MNKTELIAAIADQAELSKKREQQEREEILRLARP